MTLLELFLDAETNARSLVTIYAAKPWTVNSEAELVQSDAECVVAPEVKLHLKQRGLLYFLETNTIREILQGYVGPIDRTPQQKFDYVVYYAENDAFPDE